MNKIFKYCMNEGIAFHYNVWEDSIVFQKDHETICLSVETCKRKSRDVIKRLRGFGVMKVLG